MTDMPNPKRPRAHSFVSLDLENLYEELELSPQATLQEIKAVINERRKASIRKKKELQMQSGRSRQEFGEAEAELAKLVKIEKTLGTAKARAAYDAKNPQNELLTVQPSPRDRWLDPRYRADLATAWLLEELGIEASIPSPSNSEFWIPDGQVAELAKFIDSLARKESRKE